MHEFVRVLNEQNLTTWYVLPLVGMNIKDFGSSNLLNTYLFPDGSHIVAHIKSLFDCNTQVTGCNAYAGHAKPKEGVYLVYRLDNRWLLDIQRFMKGQYSMMSKEAKELITDGSTLQYRHRDKRTDTDITDARLLALEKSTVLRRKWAEVLKIPEHELPEELMEAPRQDWFITLDFKPGKI